ncbi:MAG: carboxypeptidase regulatory-like domain-containing protein, partial [Gammaproteobacteria bacterium]
MRSGLLLLALAAPSFIFGQAGLGSITGTVADTSGAVIAGAHVTLVQLTTKTTREIVTNAQGIFNLPSVVPGGYTLTFEATGFREKKLDNLVINGFQELSLGQVQLAVGSGPVTQVTVSAEQQLVKDSGVRYETIQSQQVSEMPNNGRNWATLLKIIPGSNATTDSGINGREYGYYGYQDFSINGKSDNTTQINLDGGSIVDHGSDAKVTVSPSLESIQEISILTNNFTAEYGNRSGAVVNIVTKSGT